MSALSGSSVPVGVELTRLSSNCREVLVLLVEGGERSISALVPHERELGAELLRVVDLFDTLRGAVLDCSGCGPCELIALRGCGPCELIALSAVEDLHTIPDKLTGEVPIHEC